jgi:hypothetical protein
LIILLKEAKRLENMKNTKGYKTLEKKIVEK